MKTKKNYRFFWLVLCFAFIAYITVYISNKYGYYDYKKTEQVILTEEKIKQFENDIKSGKDVLLENYIVDKKNYQTKISNSFLKVSNFFTGIIKTSVEKVFNYIASQVN